MAKLIVKSAFMYKKSTLTSSSPSAYIEYNATREGVEQIKFEDFVKYELEESVVAEHLNYNAKREGVELHDEEEHGLFNQNGKCDLNEETKTAEDAYNNGSIVFRQIISLRPEDALNKNLTSAEGWQKILSVEMPKVAKKFDIDLDNFKWNCAYHPNTDNPHIHLIFYSLNPEEGYSSKEETKSRTKQLKSQFVNSIFKDEIREINQAKQLARDNAKMEISKIDILLLDEVKALKDILPKEGKRTYGYLPKEIKTLVNDTLRNLIESNPKLANEVNKYINAQVEQHLNYNGGEVENVLTDRDIELFRNEKYDELINPTKKYNYRLHNELLKLVDKLELLEDSIKLNIEDNNNNLLLDEVYDDENGKEYLPNLHEDNDDEFQYRVAEKQLLDNMVDTSTSLIRLVSNVSKKGNDFDLNNHLRAKIRGNKKRNKNSIER